MAVCDDAHPTQTPGEEDLDVNKENICAQCTEMRLVFINELLCDLVNKMNIMSQENIILLCLRIYSTEEVLRDKDLFYKVTKDAGRNIKHTKDDKDKKNLQDMMTALQEKGEDLPLFVASKLCKLPPVDFNNIDVCALLSKIQQSQAELLVLKASMEKHNNVADTLKGVANDLQVRLGRIK